MLIDNVVCILLNCPDKQFDRKGFTIYIFYVKHKKPIMKALVYHGPRDVQIDDKPNYCYLEERYYA